MHRWTLSVVSEAIANFNCNVIYFTSKAQLQNLLSLTTSADITENDCYFSSAGPSIDSRSAVTSLISSSSFYSNIALHNSTLLTVRRGLQQSKTRPCLMIVSTPQMVSKSATLFWSPHSMCCQIFVW